MLERQLAIEIDAQIGCAYSATKGSAGPQSLFLTQEWFENFIETVAVPSGITPLFLRADEPTAPLLALGMRAGAIGSLTNYYTCGYGVAALGTEPAAVAVGALIDQMVNLPRTAPEIRLAPILEDDPSLTLLHDALSRIGWVVERYYCHANWSLPVEGRSYDQYFSALSPRMRNTVMRKRRTFSKAFGTMAILRGKDALTIGLPAFLRVYATSWKEPEFFPDFIPGLCQQFAALDLLRIGIAWLDGKPVAAQLWLNYHGRAMVYKLAFDETYRKLSVGTLLTSEMLRYAFDEDKVTLIDHLTGDDSYKRDWMTHRKTYYGISAHDPHTIMGSIARVRRFYKRAIGKDV